MGVFAWVTLATNDSYSLGALVLAHSLKQADTAHQLAVLVTPGVTSAMREKLTHVFNVVQEVNILDSRDEANLKLLKRPELGITFTKLHCWRLTQFEKCVFLDADTLVLQNSDELFEREELSAAPDVGWPDCFNSGVFVYRPALDTFEKLIQFALEKGSFDGGDQGLLNLYFSEWAHKDIGKHLPFIYNMCSTACYSYLPAFKQFGATAKIIHFIGVQKPWLQYFNTETRKVHPSGDSTHLEGVLQRWWDIFCSLIHPHLSPAMQDQSQHGMSPSCFPPQYNPSINPVASADYYENAWDPWDDYDRKVEQNTDYELASTHFTQNQPTKSLHTNASSVANQTSIHHSQPQMQNYNTFSVQNSSYYQPSGPQASYHIPRVPIPPPIPQSELHKQYYHHPEPQYDHNSETQYHHQPEPQYYSKPEPQYHHHSEPQYHHSESHIEPQYYQEQNHDHHQNQDQFQYNENREVTYHNDNQTPERPRSPLNPDPILPKECESASTDTNMSLSSTIDDNSKQQDAGLAAAFSQLTLGVPRTAEQDALENVLRKQAWEVGNIDYLGKDSFDRIWEKISETLSSAPPQGPPPTEPKTTLVESQSQSQTAPQEKAQPPVSFPEKLTDKSSSLDSPKVDSSESSSPIKVQKEPAVSPATDVVQLKLIPEPWVTSEVTTELLTEQTIKSKEVVSPEEQILESVKKEEPELTEQVKEETEISAASKPELVEEEILVAPKSEPLAVEPVVKKASSPEKSILAKLPAEAKPVETEKADEQPKKEETQIKPKEATESKVDTSEPESDICQEPKPKEIVSDIICTLPSKQDLTQPPKEVCVSTEVKQPELQAPQKPEQTHNIETAPAIKEPPKVEYPAIPAAEASKEKLKADKPSEAPAAAPELDISKTTSAEVSPTTKVTGPTPPTTPSSPPIEKTKQALSAETSVPETPPPSEIGVTPTPPPRKTDKPKKAAAKPKK